MDMVREISRSSLVSTGVLVFGGSTVFSISMESREGLRVENSVRRVSWLGLLMRAAGRTVLMPNTQEFLCACCIELAWLDQSEVRLEGLVSTVDADCKGLLSIWPSVLNTISRQTHACDVQKVASTSEILISRHQWDASA